MFTQRPKHRAPSQWRGSLLAARALSAPALESLTLLKPWSPKVDRLHIQAIHTSASSGTLMTWKRILGLSSYHGNRQSLIRDVA